METKRRVAYVAHPVGAPTREGVLANLQRFERWLRWLTTYDTETSFVCSWHAYVMALDDHDPRARGLQDQLAQVERCDLMFLVGGVVTDGMALGRMRNRDVEHPEIDLTRLGPEPPRHWPTPHGTCWFEPESRHCPPVWMAGADTVALIGTVFAPPVID